VTAEKASIKSVGSALLFGLWASVLSGFDRLGLTQHMMARMSRNFYKPAGFAGYIPTEHDVFVCTYFKSGTNWMMQIAHQIAQRGHGEYEHIHEVVPWPDAPFKNTYIQLNDPSVWQTSPTHLRVIKTHLRWASVPYNPAARYVTVIRDPKDVFVSSYHFMRTLGMPSQLIPTVDKWLEHFLAPYFPLGGSWATYVAEYWAQRHRPNLKIFSYKAMKRDLSGTIAEVADFMNVELCESEQAEVAHRTTFAYMKNIEQKFDPIRFSPFKHHANGSMIRSGKHGGSSELLSREQQQRIDNHFQAELQRIGSDFPYTQFCDVVEDPSVSSLK
jgi:hypothetical protein